MTQIDPTAAELVALDEILQVLFWMKGESLAEVVEAEQLTQWVGLAKSDLVRLLAVLESRGLVERLDNADAPRWRLTETGVTEGGRRFRDEFSEITRQAHGECSDPDCDCHGDPANCSHHDHDHHHAH